MGVCVDPKGDPHKHTPDAGVGSEPCLVRPVEHDGRSGRRRPAKEGGVLVVPVHDEVVAMQARGRCESQLARRGDVGADTLVVQQTEQRDVRERLRPEVDAAVADGGTQCACVRPQRLLAEHEERRPELLRQLRGAHPADRELGAVEGRGSWEKR